MMKNQLKILLPVLWMAFQVSLTAQSFVNPMPVPYLIAGDVMELTISGAMHNFDPNGSRTDINLDVPLDAYCYNATGVTDISYLGPTLIFQRGTNIAMEIENILPNAVNTTVHWHGLNVPASADGGPHQVIGNGTSWSPVLPIIDPVQTIWYHTHLMDQTTDQVIRGLAGMIIIEDPDNDPLYGLLPNEYGVNDLPICIQEKGFVLDSMTVPPTATAIKAGEKPGNGPWTLVNGVVGAVAHVPQSIVRLRILNGSPRKMFHIGLSTDLSGTSGFQTMWMFATGGGYIDYPRPTDSTLMSIGDRREFLVDFSQLANGDTVYMRNLAVPADANYGSTLDDALMAFVVDNSIQPDNPIASIPAELVDYELAPGPVFRTRTKDLIGVGGSGQVWTIDGTPMNLQVLNDTVLVNTKERWIINNTTNQAHPFHIHKVQFQVEEYVGLLGTIDTAGIYTFPDLPDELVGYKDVQLIRAGARLSFVARFDSFPSPLMPSEGFMYHCHILTHEDTSMMHQFVVVDSADYFTNTIIVEPSRELFVFPNPASGMLYFSGDFAGPGSLFIYDLSGRLLIRREIDSLDATELPVGDLPRGMILIEFISGEDRYLQKVLLE